MVVPYPLDTPSFHHHHPTNGHSNHQYPRTMDRNPADYQNTPISTPTYTTYQPAQGEGQGQSGPQSNQNADQQPSPQERPTTYSSSGTPTSDVYHQRTPTFPPEQLIGRGYEGVHRYPTSTTGGMVQRVATSNSPGVKQDPEISEDSTVAAPSPTTFNAAAAAAYQYQAAPHIQEGYVQPPPGPNGYTWPYSTYTTAASPSISSPPVTMPVSRRPQTAEKRKPTQHMSTVYSFVPIPGAQQHKRPRRRYEEIERMYKCGWNGCEKAYGTLNHLNAHVTMQSHGQKRTPEEFKEIRKEWKQKKKEEEQRKKQQEEERRQRESTQNTEATTPTTTAAVSAPETQSASSNASSNGVYTSSPSVTPTTTAGTAAVMDMHYAPSHYYAYPGAASYPSPQQRSATQNNGQTYNQ